MDEVDLTRIVVDFLKERQFPNEAFTDIQVRFKDSVGNQIVPNCTTTLIFNSGSGAVEEEIVNLDTYDD